MFLSKIGEKIWQRPMTLFALAMSFNAGFSSTVNAAPLDLALPVDCKIGVECFLQQMPDMDLSKNIVDPKCGSASYDGHKGTDIRLLSMADIKRNVSVLAAASGLVKGVRDGEKDRLVFSAADRSSVKNKACGNGVVIDHGDGIETQYCHMKMGSISVKKGQRVTAGDRLGAIGASGLVQFPHLHISLRQNGETLDPFTGRALGESCNDDVSGSWWQDKSFTDLTGDGEILKTGLAGNPVNYDDLVIIGGPPIASVSDSAIVGWVWFINLKKDDRIYMKLTGPNGLSVENITEPLDRNKASWLSFTGKKRKPEKGDYAFEVRILRNQSTLKTHNSNFTVK